MTPETLKKAQTLNNEIWYIEKDIQDLNEILNDYDSFGSSINFKRNKDLNNKSFGSKKYSFKLELKLILEKLLIDANKELLVKKSELEKL